MWMSLSFPPAVESDEVSEVGVSALVEEERKRARPWTGEIDVEPRRWKEGGTVGTWSRCIC